MLTEAIIDCKNISLIPLHQENRAELNKHQPTGTDTQEAPKMFTAELLDRKLNDVKNGTLYAYTIRCNNDGAFLGYAEIRVRASVLQLDFWIRPDERHQGYGTETYRALITFCRKEIGDINIVFKIDAENKTATRIVEKNSEPYSSFLNYDVVDDSNGGKMRPMMYVVHSR